MSYRAQFPFLTPPGYRDEPYEYFFDPTNLPALATQLAVGEILIVNLPIDVGPDFYWRGTQIIPDPTQTVGVQFVDSVGNFLSSSFEPAIFYECFTVNQTLGANVEASEPEIVCPGGTVVQLRIQRLA